jgi:hypothetical protein
MAYVRVEQRNAHLAGPVQLAFAQQQLRQGGFTPTDAGALPAEGVARIGPQFAGQRTAPGQHEAADVAQVSVPASSTTSSDSSTPVAARPLRACSANGASVWSYWRTLERVRPDADRGARRRYLHQRPARDGAERVAPSGRDAPSDRHRSAQAASVTTRRYHDHTPRRIKQLDGRPDRLRQTSGRHQDTHPGRPDQGGPGRQRRDDPAVLEHRPPARGARRSSQSKSVRRTWRRS